MLDRKAMRWQERLAADKVCNICLQNMILSKDVTTFFNLRIGRVACCNRNPTGGKGRIWMDFSAQLLV
ncbi:hypothetical protein RYX36_014636 [Vicia faba]